MFATIGDSLIRLAFLAPVVVFAVVSGFMNVKFAATLGSDEFTRSCFVALGIAAAVYAGLGLELTRLAWKRGARTKAAAAFAFLIIAAVYDATAAYGFAAAESTMTENTRKEAARKKASAQAKVDRTKAALAKYSKAPEVDAATETVSALEKRTPDAVCRRSKLTADDKTLCDGLATARQALADAKAKKRLEADLATAEDDAAKVPDPPPLDARAATFGADFIHWLPVVVLQVGSLLGAYAALLPKRPPPPTPEPVRPAPPVIEPAPKRQAAAAGATPKLKQTTTGNLTASIAAIIHDPGQRPAGVRVDSDGWLSGPQRKLAQQCSLPLSKFNQQLHAAAMAGALQVDTTGGRTRIRLGSSATN